MIFKTRDSSYFSSPASVRGRINVTLICRLLKRRILAELIARIAEEYPAASTVRFPL
jgi:hypothetical protein